MVSIKLKAKRSDPPIVTSLCLNGRELLSEGDEAQERADSVSKLSFVTFTAQGLKEILADAWSIPIDQLAVICTQGFDKGTKYRLPKGVNVRWPAPE
jgi:hypothetical protein